MKKYGIMLLLAVLITIAACTQTKTSEITSFEECAAAGNPVMESNPRLCNANGQNFVENYNGVNNKEIHICTDEEKAAQACTLDYSPVCGKVENQVQCIKAPCPPIVEEKTFGNGCGACSAGAISYISGECETESNTQLANPASVYCVEEKGELDIIDTNAGQAGYCNLPDGRSCEEWAYYRSEGKECLEQE